MLPTGIHITDIPENGSKGFVCDNTKYFALKQQGKLYIYENACPHIGIPLEWVEDQFLDSSGTMIQCANHGALFVIHTGLCVAGPCGGKKLKAVAFTIVDDVIFLN